MKERNKTGLVIGGAGFIGDRLTTSLIANNWIIKSYDRISSLNPEVESIIGDLNEREQFERTLDGVDTIFYFASHSVPSIHPLKLSHEIDFTLRHLNLVLESMVTKKVSSIVFPSSGGAIYGNCLSPASEEAALSPMISYGVGKMLSEEAIKFYSRIAGIKYLILRLGNVFGCVRPRNIRQGFIETALDRILNDDEVEIWGDLKPTRDYIHVDDVCSAVVALLNKKNVCLNHTFNIGTGVGTSLGEILKIIEELTNHTVSYTMRNGFPTGIESIILDNSKINKMTGWSPGVPFKKGIADLILAKKSLMGKV